MSNKLTVRITDVSTELPGECFIEGTPPGVEDMEFLWPMQDGVDAPNSLIGKRATLSFDDGGSIIDITPVTP